jgi:hypothetical protein
MARDPAPRGYLLFLALGALLALGLGLRRWLAGARTATDLTMLLVAPAAVVVATLLLWRSRGGDDPRG